jgi:hypothetical protein
MGIQVTTRNNTRNQLTIDYLLSHFCLFDNRFIPATFKNNTGLPLNLVGAIPVARDTTTANQVIPVLGPVGAPALPVLTNNATGGTLAAQPWFIKQTAVTVYGETTGSAEATVTTTGTTSSIGVAGTAVLGALSYKTYIGGATNAEGQWFASSTPNITLTTATGTAGTVPTSDTTGNLANVIGFTISEGTVTLANAATSPLSVVIHGNIDANYIIMPPNTTFDQTVGNKAFQDILNGIGFTMDRTGIDNTKIDN